MPLRTFSGYSLPVFRIRWLECSNKAVEGRTLAVFIFDFRPYISQNHRIQGKVLVVLDYNAICPSCPPRTQRYRTESRPIDGWVDIERCSECRPLSKDQIAFANQSARSLAQERRAAWERDRNKRRVRRGKEVKRDQGGREQNRA